MVEVEYSPFSLEIESNGVLATCKELGIPIVAYSPLARGLITGTITKLEDIPKDDYRRNFECVHLSALTRRTCLSRFPSQPISTRCLQAQHGGKVFLQAAERR